MTPTGSGVTVSAGAGLSIAQDPLEAGLEAARGTAAGLGGADPDVAVVFASGTHLAAPEAMLEGVNSVLQPNSLIGCGAAGVLAGTRELESGTAVSVWAASFGDDAEVSTFHVRMEGDDEVHLEGMPDLSDASGAVLLSDPYSFPADAALMKFAGSYPTVPVLGGIASARLSDGSGALFLGEEVCEGGAVGLALRGVEMLPCVSQGAAPFGREVTITAAQGNVIRELAGRPALETVETIIAELGPRERALVAGGLLIGIVIDAGKPDYEQGDFLVRGVLGADPDSGSLVVGAAVREGQVVRLHARDAQSAHEDLRRALRLRIEAMASARAAGALVFSCNGRGKAMFGSADHDASAVQHELGGVPTAGFFAAGEIGPVGGRSFLHGFTATIAVFPA